MQEAIVLGYMSSEYAMNGVYSTKSDVFSFGILILEIVSGMRSNDCYQKSTSFSLIDHESSADRPAMSDVVFMLSNATHLPSPRKPSFIIQSKYNDSNSEAAARALVHSNNRVPITTMEAR
ncbi:unnamed protein product [Linum tenue]|uniref:Serine-threonine/tyrosine-protein kinase catalytic domain-containing protein n=1 Tax=Linum tenue TaxID=586396 RepID=A0AAV0L0D3_9ROSI|nr:unnamed protein product [Linum tenue]